MISNVENEEKIKISAEIFEDYSEEFEDLSINQLKIKVWNESEDQFITKLEDKLDIQESIIKEENDNDNYIENSERLNNYENENPEKISTTQKSATILINSGSKVQNIGTID